VRPISRGERDWLCHELAPGGRVVRVRALRGGVSCSVHALLLESAADTRQNVVVRRYGEDWNNDPDVCEREFKLLQALARLDYPAPRPLLLDRDGAIFATPTLVMTRLSGRADLQPRNIDGFLEQLAQALANLHRLPTSGSDFLPRHTDRVESAIERRAQREDPLESTVWQRVHALWPTVARDTRVIHGDFWPGNTVWYRTRLSGVVDWEMAALGTPARDVATCRCDLANLFDPDTADAFARRYERAAGASVSDLAFWDLLVSTGALRYIDDWSVGYRALGRDDLTAPEARRRVERFARAALAETEH